MNGDLEPGWLCPKSFAKQPWLHVTPAEHPDWGVCISCGEIVNIKRRRMIPMHRVPAAREDQAT